jgi:hypothetical protein
MKISAEMGEKIHSRIDGAAAAAAVVPCCDGKFIYFSHEMSGFNAAFLSI